MHRRAAVIVPQGSAALRPDQSGRKNPPARPGPFLPAFARHLVLLTCLILSPRAEQTIPADPHLTAKPLGPRSGPPGATLFVQLAPGDTDIVAENLYADPAMWAQRYAEFATGSLGTGVAIGDYDRDGRPDIFVVSKTETCRLFRNRGDWKFEDVTHAAGVGDSAADALIWKQGATFADVNNDGWLDLYVCRFEAPNLLYINQGDGTFREEAAARGLAVTDGSVMAAFCDYDRDGWLDALVQVNRPDSTAQHYPNRNYLFRNRGDGFFTDVTQAAGIDGRAQGHSAIWWDMDEDGWPDLYVANDFTPPDKLYRNNRDGTFTDVIYDTMPCMPFSSMGADLGDVNNDGRIDLFVADMAARTREKDQRTMANARGLLRDPAGPAAATPSVMRNVLFLGTGTGRTLEAARLAGVEATDWTWSVRLEDLDNDGWLDLHVTNGMYREPHNADLMARVAAAASPTERIRIERASPRLNERNLAFRNRGDLSFEEVGAAWGLDEMGVSLGAAFGDLDGDGDLDLVYTNYRGGVSVFRNDAGGHRVLVELEGTRSNRSGVGARVEIETADGRQVRQLVLARGVLSSSEPVLHFGLGAETLIRKLRVIWPDGGGQTFTDLPADRRYRVIEPAVAAEHRGARETEPARALFTEAGATMGLALTARGPAPDDPVKQPLMPVRQNRFGPTLAVGDLNGDQRDDVVMGGAAGNPLRVLFANAEGRFDETNAVPARRPDALNDGPVLIFDANGDGANDLLVSRGGVGLPAGSAEYQPRLYLNDGRGALRPAPDGALPPLFLSVGTAVVADFDRDGRLDVFLGARVEPGRHPASPGGVLLANRGDRFEDITDQIAPELRKLGLVTAALWSDVDDDGWLDLIVASEWGPVRVFRNLEGRGFADVSEQAGFTSAGTGWWTAIAAADFNGDGRMDYVLGNRGLNTGYRATPEQPAVLFAGNLGGRQGWDLVEGYHDGDRLVPRRSRRELGAAIPGVLQRFPRNDRFARATLGEVFGEPALAGATRLAVTEVRSGVLLSGPDGRRAFAPLPRVAQIAPLQGVLAGDFDGDGLADLVAVQNCFAPIPSEGRFDGGIGQFLRGDGRGGFLPVAPAESGLVVPGDADGLVAIDFAGDGWPDLVTSRQGAPSLAFRNQGRPGYHMIEICLEGPPGNPTGIGSRITLELADRSRQSAEVRGGSGYSSQSGAGVFVGWPDGNPPRRLTVRGPDGATFDFMGRGESGRLILKMPLR